MYANMQRERHTPYFKKTLLCLTSYEAAKDNLKGKMKGEWAGQEGEIWDTTRRLSALV